MMSFSMSWSQRGHDVYLVLRRVKKDLDLEKVEISLTDQSCFIKLPNGHTNSWNFFLDVDSKNCQRIQNNDCLIIVVPKKDTTLYWPDFKKKSSPSSTASSPTKTIPAVKKENGRPTIKNLPENDQETSTEDQAAEMRMALIANRSDGSLMGGNRTTNKRPQSPNSFINESSSGESAEKQTSRCPSTQPLNKKLPCKLTSSDVKHDGYQTDTTFVLSMYVPMIDPWSVKLVYYDDKVNIIFKTRDEKFLQQHCADNNVEFEWTALLNGVIVPNSCTHTLTLKTLQIKLQKKHQTKWKSLLVVPDGKNKTSPSLTQTTQPRKIMSGTKTTVKSSLEINNSAPSSSKITSNGEPSSSSSSLRGTSSMAWQQQTPKTVVKPGYTGLDNLGNTCFINSVLQALVNVDELKDYFLERRFERDINLKNPLGMQGRVAESFFGIVEALWSGCAYSFAPRQLRSVIGMREPRWNDFMQHDAQEFMAFLLDVLHEDLNRIQDKPYYEIQESSGEDDQVVAAESWKLHKSRNDSKIVDLFHGLFKSRLICPKCVKNSIKFDPFLFLPLPMPKPTRLITVICQPREQHLLPIKLLVRVSSERSTATEIFTQASDKLGCDVDKLRMFEVRNGRIYRFLVPTSHIDDVGEKDLIFVQEVMSREEAEEPVYEVGVVQRVNITQVATCCNFCGNIQQQSKLKRCVKCLQVGYCNQQCQKSDWPKHRLSCSRIVEYVGTPFIVCIPRSKSTFVDICNILTATAMKYVDVVFTKPSGDEILPCDLAESFDEFPLELTPIKWNGCRDEAVTSLRDEGERLVDLTKFKLIAMDWQSDQKLPVHAEVTTRKLQFSKVIESRHLNKGIHLHDCIQLFTEPEVLAPEEAWYCPRCKHHEEATKEMSLWTLPDTLIVQLKRFSFKNYLWRDKIDCFVDFPISDLNMTPYLTGGTQENCVYDLFAVVNHHGGIFGGHYTSFVRLSDDPQSEWRLCDDSNVKLVPSNRVVSKAAYVMFYRKRKVSPSSERQGMVEHMMSTESLVEQIPATLQTSDPSRDSPALDSPPGISNPSSPNGGNGGGKNVRERLLQAMGRLADPTTAGGCSKEATSAFGTISGLPVLRYEEVFGEHGQMIAEDDDDDDEFHDASSTSFDSSTTFSTPCGSIHSATTDLPHTSTSVFTPPSLGSVISPHVTCITSDYAAVASRHIPSDVCVTPSIETGSVLTSPSASDVPIVSSLASGASMKLPQNSDGCIKAQSASNTPTASSSPFEIRTILPTSPGTSTTSEEASANFVMSPQPSTDLMTLQNTSAKCMTSLQARLMQPSHRVNCAEAGDSSFDAMSKPHKSGELKSSVLLTDFPPPEPGDSLQPNPSTCDKSGGTPENYKQSPVVCENDSCDTCYTDMDAID